MKARAQNLSLARSSPRTRLRGNERSVPASKSAPKQKASLLVAGAAEAKRKKLGAQCMIAGEGGVTQAGSLDLLARSLGYLKPWGQLED
jgi:hypothetical protein